MCGRCIEAAAYDLVAEVEAVHGQIWTTGDPFLSMVSLQFTRTPKALLSRVMVYDTGMIGLSAAMRQSARGLPFLNGKTAPAVRGHLDRRAAALPDRLSGVTLRHLTPRLLFAEPDWTAPRLKIEVVRVLESYAQAMQRRDAARLQWHPLAVAAAVIASYLPDTALSAAKARLLRTRPETIDFWGHDLWIQRILRGSWVRDAPPIGQH